MEIIFDSKEEATVFKQELFNIQTVLAKNNAPAGPILLIEKLFYLSTEPGDKKK